jgi:hypothetical protein
MIYCMQYIKTHITARTKTPLHIPQPILILISVHPTPKRNKQICHMFFNKIHSTENCWQKSSVEKQNTEQSQFPDI